MFVITGEWVSTHGHTRPHPRTHLSVCLGAVHVVQHLPGPQPLERLLHCHHTLVLQQHNTGCGRVGCDMRGMYTLHTLTKCDAVLQQWTNPAIQNSRTGTGSTGRSPFAARFTHTNMDAVHAFSEQLNMLGLDLVASFTLLSPSHLPPITLPSPAPGAIPCQQALTCMSRGRAKKGSTVADSFEPCFCTMERSSPPKICEMGDSL